MNYRDILDYNPDTGLFTWKDRPDMPKQWTRRYAGKPAGNREARGYIRIRVNGVAKYAHRIAWEIMGGGDAREIDHINENKSDNRWANLRAATHSQNAANSKRSPTKGVHWNTKRRKFIAQIACQRKHYWLGEFDNFADAKAAYEAKARELFGEFA